MTTRRFVLVRHGEAALNLPPDDAVITEFDPDSPLTAVGVRQAEQVAAGLADAVKPDAVHTSPHRRAADTAAVIGAALDVPVVADARLAEFGVSARFAEPVTTRQWDAILDARLRFPDDEAAPGVETLTAQRSRLGSFLAERCAASGEHLIVAHAETIQAMLLDLLGLEPRAYLSFRFKVSRTGVFVVDHPPGGPPSLITANAKGHLGCLL